MRLRPTDERLATEAAAREAPRARAESPAAGIERLFSAMGNAAVARMLQRAPAEGATAEAALEAVRKHVLDNVTGRIVEARVHFEASPPEYSKAFVAASQAEAALERIRGGSGQLPPEVQAALATRGPHIAAVALEALDQSFGDVPSGARGGLHQAMHDLAPIAGPEAEKRLLGGSAAGPLAGEPPKVAPNPFD